MIDNAFALRAPAELLAEIGRRARQQRLARNLSQRDIAKRAGIGSATVERFERSGRTSIENALRIAIALGAEEGFERLFEAPTYRSIDEALGGRRAPDRKRARKPR